MNQGRIWCVVHPTVGLPLFLGSVAATSLIVHASIMTHTTWMDTYWMGSKARAAQTSSLVPQAKPAAFQAGPGFSLTVAPAPANGTQQAAYVITVTPTKAASAPPIHTASVN